MTLSTRNNQMVYSFNIQWRHQTYTLTFSIGFFLLCLSFFCIFCLLSIWQFHRYHYKQALLSTYHQRQISSAITLNNALKQNKTQADLQFQPVKAQGHYLPALSMLIQNQQYKSQMGFEVLTPFQLAGEKQLLLVDRGWIPNHLLQIKSPSSDSQVISGHIKLINEYHFILGNNIYAPNARPLQMQKIDTSELKKLTGQAFFPFILRLNATEPNGFIRDWVISTVLPERHLGYAVQWLALAIMIVIAYFCCCCQRVRKSC